MSLYVLGDRVVLQGLQAKPELNGAAGTVIEVGAPGCGPDGGSGRYGVRVELPAAVRNAAGIKVKPANLRLAPAAVAKELDALDLETSAHANAPSPLPTHLDTKFGKMNVRVVEGAS